MNRLHGFLVVAALVAIAPTANAQLPIPSFAVVGGVSSYDLSGTGSTPIGALRVDIPLLALVAEGSLGVMAPKEDPGRTTYVIPEVQLQYQILPILVRPYIGVGGGLFKGVSGAKSDFSQMTLSAAAGIRATLPLTGLGLRVEGRIRGIGSGFNGSSAELTAGISF
jgi:hypothetical protein